MSSANSTHKPAASSPEVIDVDTDELKSSINAHTITNGVPKKANGDSETETENELESIIKKSATADGTVKGQGSSKTESNQEQARNTECSPGSTPVKTAEICIKRTHRVKLEEVRNFDILLLNSKNCNTVRQAKIEFYTGLISYRKLIDRLRPVFLERNTPMHKTKIGKWLVGKITDKGGRFLKEDGDGATGNCKVMSFQESLQYTIDAFERKPWTAISALMGESSHEHKIHAKAQSQRFTAELLSENSTSLDQDTLEISKKDMDEHIVNNHVTSDSPHKKMKLGATGDATTLHESSSSTLHGNSDQNQSNRILEDLREKKFRESPLLQKCLMERKVIRAEFTENKEILMMRQERLSHLESDFRLFQERQMFLPDERWLAEKILRQEEIFENRELLAIQNQRCRRLHTLLDLNERQMFEHQTRIRREKLKLENGQDATQQGAPFEPGKVVVKNDIARRDSEPGKVNAKESIENNIVRGSTRARMEEELRRRQQIGARQKLDHHIAIETEIKRRKAFDARQKLDHHIAIEAEIKRRKAFDQKATMEQMILHNQTASMEQVIQHKTAMEQEMKYRQAMEHARQRQAVMQESMKARQIMMSRTDRPLPPPSSESTHLQTTKRGDRILPKATPDAPTSMVERKNDAEEAIVVIGDDNDFLTTEGENAQEVDAQEEEEEDDDDFIVI